MKILEVCPYSAGACGVFNRVLTESIALKEMGHDVRIFSSNAIKGSKEEAKKEEIVGGIPTTRFPYMKLGGESFMKWNYKKEAMVYAPDIIIVHNYRHLHTTQALKIKEELPNCKVILVTHAPFVVGNITRGFISKIIVNIYDKYIGPKTLNKFDAIVRICNWEEPFLLDLGVDTNKIYTIPNVLPNIYFETTPKDPINKSVLFLGRIAPVKNIEFIYELAKLMPDFNFSIVGPVEESYFLKLSLKYAIKPNNITFYPPIYNIDNKITAYDSHKYFILPSIREAMPQALMEAMSRGSICISTNTDGAHEIIVPKTTGYICGKNTPEEARDYILFNEKKPLNTSDIVSHVFNNNSIDVLKNTYNEIFKDISEGDSK